MANLKRRIAEKQTELKRLKRDMKYAHRSGFVTLAKARIIELEEEIRKLGNLIEIANG